MGQSIDLTQARYQMLRNVLPESIKQVNFATIDMDITMLSVADILRNISKSFPKNTAMRNAIANGQMAVCVLCKTDLLKPVSGLIIVVCDDGASVKIKSKDYIVLGISESTLASNDKILDMLDRLTTYLIKNYAEVLPHFEKFYSLYIYDAYEMEENGV